MNPVDGMRTLCVRTLENKLSEYLRLVKSGEHRDLLALAATAFRQAAEIQLETAWAEF